MSGQRTKLGSPQMDWARMPAGESRTGKSRHISPDRMTAAGTMKAAHKATDRHSTREPYLSMTVAINNGMPSATRKRKSGAAAARNCLPSDVAGTDITARNCDTINQASMKKGEGVGS